MYIFRSSAELKEFLSGLPKGTTTGFVPTMGALHNGHAALVKQSVNENDVTICSIFVNPLQFNRREDLDSYPDRLEADRQLLEESNCQVLFTPTADEIYKDESRLECNFGSIGKGMEAEYRPGHFEGVAEVIHRFFTILDPTKAYFGEKDYQQLAIIRWLTKEYNHKTEIVPCETVRDKSGLAMSSRNYNLSPDQYNMASEIYEVLNFCKDHMSEYKAEELEKICIKKLEHNFRPEYFKIADQYTMKPIENWSDSTSPRAFVAAYCGDVRLIDNISLKKDLEV